ncbi:MAG: RibD family protein [Limnochordales bacterium]|nr:RibD family protein [Limnochordales bacterium]
MSKTSTEVQEEAALAIYDRLLFPPAPAGRPLVAINMVATVDGRTTLSRSGMPVRERIGSEVDRILMKRLRAHFDAVARGAATVRRNPYYPLAAATNANPGEIRQPLAVVFSRSGELPITTAFFREAPRPPLVVTGPLSLLRRTELEAAGAEIWEIEDERRRVPLALERLAREKKVNRLLLEGGPRLNHAFLLADAVDELFLTIAPRLASTAGGLNLSLVEGEEAFWPPLPLELVSCFRYGSELYLRYRRHPLQAGD